MEKFFDIIDYEKVDKEDLIDILNEIIYLSTVIKEIICENDLEEKSLEEENLKSE